MAFHYFQLETQHPSVEPMNRKKNSNSYEKKVIKCFKLSSFNSFHTYSDKTKDCYKYIYIIFNLVKTRDNSQYNCMQYALIVFTSLLQKIKTEQNKHIKLLKNREDKSISKI